MQAQALAEARHVDVRVVLVLGGAFPKKLSSLKNMLSIEVIENVMLKGYTVFYRKIWAREALQKKGRGKPLPRRRHPCSKRRFLNPFVAYPQPCCRLSY